MADVKPSCIASDHSQSHIIQLPDEVKIMMLRLLLLHSGILGTRARHASASYSKDLEDEKLKRQGTRRQSEEIVASYDLSPAILATCQNLYRLGWPILYGSNTLGLQVWVPYTSCISVYAVPEMMMEGNDPSGRMSGPKGSFSKLLAKFQNIHLDVQTNRGDPTSLRDLIIVMAASLSSKNLRVKFFDEDFDKDFDDDLESAELNDHVGFLALLRCKTFTILGCEASESMLSRVTKTVVSNRPVLDLWKLKNNLRQYSRAMCSCVYEIPGVTECSCQEWWYSELDGAAFKLDAIEFYRLRAEALVKIDEMHRSLRTTVFKDDVAVDEEGLPISICEMDGSDVRSQSSEQLEAGAIDADM